MPVEILTVSLSDESIGLLAMRIASLLKGAVPVTESNPPSAQTPQDAERPGFPTQADPWQNGGVPSAAPAAPASTPTPGHSAAAPPPSQPYQPPAQQQYPQGPQPPQAPPQSGPQCMHGAMRYVPAGFSQSTGRSYNAFWGCTAPRGAQDKCKSVTA